MRVQSFLSPNFSVANSGVQVNKKNSMSSITQLMPSSSCHSNVIQISFRGNFDKNPNQFVSIAPEHGGLGLKNYAIGGLANVADEGPNSWVKHYGADVRSFLPYHSYANDDGGIKIIKVLKDAKGKPILSADPKDFKVVDLSYKLQEDEKFVIQDAPSKGKCAFRILEETGIDGSVKRPAILGFDIEAVPYKLFKMADRAGKDTAYIVHTKAMAKAAKAYAYTQGWEEIHYADFNKAIAEHILPRLNSEAHGNFNPANIWLHDRPAFLTIPSLVNKAASGDPYYQGLRVHSTLHNPGRSYQGHNANPIEFFKLVADEGDLARLKAHPDFSFLQRLDSKHNDKIKLTKEELEQANKILKPFLEKFVDDFGVYNISAVPVAAIRTNPSNYTGGTVSMNYGFEMANHNTPDIAGGLTRMLASIPTINITNGSTPSNLRLNDKNAGFGRGGNLLTDNKSGFQTYEPKFDPETKKITNIGEILTAKKTNKKWLIDLIADKAKAGEAELKKVFFNAEQIEPPAGSKVQPTSVLGSLSSFEEGDKLLMGWGRPDAQKGYPTTIQSFLDFLKDSSVSEEVRKHTKLLLGAGPEPWEKNDAADWVKIQSLVKEVQELEGGKFKGNVCYVNGLFPNRLVACADLSIFSSRYEPCGITPLESFTAGTPVMSIKTGGAPDFVSPYQVGQSIDNATGFLTKKAFMVSSEILGKPSDMTAELLDAARIESSAKELAQVIKTALMLDDLTTQRMAENALYTKTDWHENIAFNKGVSANQRYMNEVFHLSDVGNKLSFFEGRERNTKDIRRLVGDFGPETVISKVETVVVQSTEKVKAVVKSGMSKRAVVLSAVAGTALIATASYLFSKKHAPESAISVGSPLQSNNYDKYARARVSNHGFSHTA